MRSAWTVGLSAAQVLLLVVTFFLPGFGAQVWHHLASLGLVLVVAVVARGPLTASRRVLAIGALATSVLAVVSGFYLLYWKEGIRVDGYQDWGVWWHVAWSWAAAVFFFQHTWINRVQFVHFFRRTAQRAGPLALHVGGYILLAVAIAVTWSPSGRVWFDNGNYLRLGFIGWLVVLVPTYGIWAWRARRLDRDETWTWRRGIDLALVPAAALATLSGIPLAFFDDVTDPAGLKYTAKIWHVWPSIAFAVLVFVHSAQVWRSVRRHWKAMA